MADARRDRPHEVALGQLAGRDEGVACGAIDSTRHINSPARQSTNASRLAPGAGGLGQVSLVPYEIETGGIPVRNVVSPG